jgi:uncharacterized protein (TIGR02246 family)
LTFAGACAHLGGSRGGEAEVANVRAAIAAANAEFAQALVRGDARAMAAVFAEDGEIIPATQRGYVSGRAAIEAYQAERLQARRYLHAVITTLQLEVSGDLAWETGTSRVTIQQGESAPVTVTGRYLAVWKREPDGRWRIRAELPVADPVQ